MKPSEQRTLAAVEAELRRMIRYDDESIVNGKWARQRYECCFPGLAEARKATVQTFSNASARRCYRVMMMPASAPSPQAQPLLVSTPREIRAKLAREEIGHFDREYRQAMAEAAESLDLAAVLATLERWRRVAWSTQDDPDAHRRMLENATRLNAGESVPTVPSEQVKARLGL